VSSVSRTPQGRWRARYRDPAGRSRSRTFDTKVKARRFLDATNADMHRGQWVDPAAGRLTLVEWAATYLATVTNLRPTTLATYQRDLDRYVLPRFGHLPLAGIRALDIRTWLANELTAGIAPTSVHRHFCTLRRLLRVAVETDLLVKSPCAGIKPTPVEPVEIRFLTAAEVHRLAEEMHPHFRVLVYTAAYAGLRWGELIGLERARVDIANRTITVLEQLVEVKGEFLWQPPKTRAGRRRVTIPAFLADMLAEQLANRALPGPAGLVFPNRAGKPIATSSFNTAHWTPAKRRTGLDGLRWHDLRHTAVALAIAQGAHPKAIQARLGHSSVQVTLDRYGHLFPELDAAIAEGLEGTFRASLQLLPGGGEGAPQTPSRDTRRTRVTQKRHKIRASGGQSRSRPDKAKSGADLQKGSEAASGIEPLYRVLQTQSIRLVRCS
jgi:integrase